MKRRVATLFISLFVLVLVAYAGQTAKTTNYIQVKATTDSQKSTITVQEVKMLKEGS